MPMNSKLQLVLTLLAGLLLQPAAGAAADRISLAEALRTALAQQPQVLAAAADREAAEAAAQAAASGYWPRLGFSERFVATDEPGGSLFISLNQEDLKLSPTAGPYNHPPSRHDFETRLTLTQPLYDPDLGYGRQRAEVGARGAQASQRRSREEAAFAVLEAYLAIQRHQAEQAWAAQFVSETEEVVAVARQRHQAGVGLESDALRATVLLSEARRQQLAAGNNLLLARRRLALAIGAPQRELTISAPLERDRLPLPQLDEALQRGDLEALAAAGEAAALAARQAQARYLPRADLAAAYILHDEQQPFGADAGAWSVAAGLQWELFDGGARSHQVSRAKAVRRAVEERRLAAYRQARYAAEQAGLLAQEAEQQLLLAEQARTAAAAGKAILAQRYDAGLAPLTDLLAVQSELAASRRDLVAAETGLLQARARILFEQGRLLETLMPDQEEAR